VSEWQPIETAPKDGTTLLVWDGIAITTAFFQTHKYGGNWELANPGSYAEDCEINATHWMYLPEPPEQDK